MEAIKELITIVGAVLGIIITATGFLIPLVKNAKAKKALEAINKLTSVIQPYVVEAEKFANYSGAEKKQYVLTKVNAFAIANGIKYDESHASELIEQIVETSKQVNKRDKDAKTAAAQSPALATATVTTSATNGAVIKKY